MSAATAICAGPDSAADLDFVAQLRAGEREAFDLFYEAFFPRVYGFVQKKLADRADSEEVVQEVFLNIFLSIDSYRGEAPLAAWVFGVTRRTIARRFRKKRAVTVPLSDEENLGERLPDPAAATPLEHYEAEERLIAIQSVVHDDLSAEQWQIFSRHHLDGDSVTAIATSLGKTEDSIKSNLYRTRRALRST